ncbi:MAG: nucleotidyltransferase family protein [Betaproteobacteria bacterium]|nr:nucleotidyltransferase family protein [Betaproteobacteria bacterium]
MSTAILLAAGSARRFGSQKLLARLPEGVCVIEATARKLLATTPRVVAVVGADQGVGRLLDAIGCEVVVNPRATEGMGTSIACGVAQAPDAASWLIALGDMPFAQVATLGALLREGIESEHIVVPEHAGRRGHPVRFPGCVGDELRALGGDQGARRVLERHVDRTLVLRVDDPGVLADIDTPADLPVAPGAVAEGRGG